MDKQWLLSAKFLLAELIIQGYFQYTYILYVCTVHVDIKMKVKYNY